MRAQHITFNKAIKRPITLSHAMRPGLQIRHFWVEKSLFLTVTFNQKKQDKTFCLYAIVTGGDQRTKGGTIGKKIFSNVFLLVQNDCFDERKRF